MNNLSGVVNRITGETILVFRGNGAWLFNVSAYVNGQKFWGGGTSPKAGGAWDCAMTVIEEWRRMET